MDKEKCEECPKKEECFLYNLYKLLLPIAEDNPMNDFMKLSYKKGPSDKINVYDLPMISLKENPNHIPVKGRIKKFQPIDPRIERAVQFWKDVLIEETDKELVEISIEALQYLLPDINIIEDIRKNRTGTLSGIFEKCRKMKIKGFKVNTKV